jgi:type II secretory pathway pseudopilin PulG
MKRGQSPQGYTIIEVMIFLVITGALLATALLVFNGRQQRTQFTQGVREIEARIRTITNETASGYYSNQGQIGCSVTAPGNGPNLSTVSNGKQGTNEGCIFLGRVLQFKTGAKEFTVFTMVGQQYNNENKIVTSYGSTPSDARQTLIAQAPGQNGAPNATETFELPWGITVTQVSTSAADAPTVGAIGFVSSLGTIASNGSDLVSGASSLSAVPIKGTSLTGTDNTLMVSRTKAMTNSWLNPGRIVLCLSSGSGGKRAAIVIGGNNSNTRTEILYDLAECPNA